MTINFEGRTVLVTGAGHGIGRSIAAAFAQCGAAVWACGINEVGLAETLSLLGPLGRARALDVTDPAQTAEVFKEVEDSGALHILVNNAGGVRGQTGRPVEEVSDKDWQDIVSVNLTGTFICSRAAALALKRTKGSSIVNISSGAGLGVSLTGIQAYASAKAGQIGLTRQLAHELGPHGVRVNAVAPGFVLSNPDTKRQWERYGAEGQASIIDGIALRRLGHPEDIAHPVLFLASDLASWITGQVIQVNGGR